MKSASFIYAPRVLAMVHARSSTAMARKATKITARYGGLQGEGVSDIADQLQATRFLASGLRQGTLRLPHFCLAAIDRRHCHLIFQAQGQPNLQ